MPRPTPNENHPTESASTLQSPQSDVYHSTGKLLSHEIYEYPHAWTYISQSLSAQKPK